MRYIHAHPQLPLNQVPILLGHPADHEFILPHKASRGAHLDADAYLRCSPLILLVDRTLQLKRGSIRMPRQWQRKIKYASSIHPDGKLAGAVAALSLPAIVCAIITLCLLADTS
jgi:hypothetical protein